ncbi:MAG: tripartite tricarboxylate transporter substrate binding protein [Pseudomonadota bacterium]|nr:tripartite tricarboxylate transporter substrate binding protein [Pseudomonadota bacterium]
MHTSRRTLSKRQWLAGATVLTLTAAAWSPLALAQTAYPSKAIRMIIPYTPGGATDIIGRTVAQELGKVLGQPVVVDNRAGAAGNIGAAAVARESPDGYTILMGAMTSHSINSVLMGQAAGFNMIESFQPVSIVGRVPLVFVVHPSSPYKSLKALIEDAKARPGKLNYASAGNGSPQHLSGEMFKREIDATIAHVPYRGSAQALTDLMAGQVDFMIDTVPAAQGFIKGGKLVALATTTAQPVASLPDVPTAAAAGLAGFDVSSMFGIAVPAKTPDPVVARLSEALKTVMAERGVNETLAAQGAMASYTTPKEASERIAREVAMWSKVIKDGNIKPE